MIHDVVSAKYKTDYKIEVVFDNGRSGVVDFARYVELGGVFERFRDIEFFRKFSVNEELGVLTWENEVDIATETLYAEATGGPLPEWMASEHSNLG